MHTPCKLWPKTVSRDGYGRVWIQSLRVYKQAHRVAYAAHHGMSLEDIDGQLVRHKCDVRLCVNPEHLELGSPADNSQDMVDRNRQAKGSANGNSKLDADAVAEIRRLYVKGSRTQGGPALARRFKVTSATIHNIVNHKQW